MINRLVLLFLLLLISQCTYAQVKFSKKNGKYDSQDEHGIRVVGTVSNYLANGKFTYSTHNGYDSNGRERWRVTEIRYYKKGILDGSYYRFELNGDTIEVGAYKNDRKIGEWRTFTNKELTGRIVYSESGDGIGWQLFRNEDKSTRKEIYGAGGRNYQWNFTPEGKYSSRGELSGNVKDGLWLYYDSTEAATDTFPVISAQYKAGTKHGEEKRMRGGVVYASAQFADGTMHGVRKLYAPNKQVICEEVYVEGKLNGKQSRYSHNGKQYSDWNYINGVADGVCVIYDTITGVLAEEHQFESGILITMKRYSANHKLIAEQLLLERDSLVYSIKEYHENGAKKSTGRLIGTRRTGPYESWHRNGKNNMKAFFRNDRYYESVTVWNDKGIKVFFTKCTNGRDSGPEDVWSDAGTQLIFGTLAYEKQRAKYIPPDLVAHYEDLYVMGDVVVNYVSPKGPWAGWTYGIELSGHFIGTDQHTVPTFPGGSAALADFVELNVRYPEYESSERISGKNVVTFTVRADGSISAIDLARSASPGLDAEALRLVGLMPDWKPATINGVPREGRCWMEFDWRIIQRKERE